MTLTALLFLLFFTDGVSSEGNCTYYDVLKHLKLTENKNLLTLVRPVKKHTKPTEVHLDMLLYAILDVREMDQIFVSYLWLITSWNNDYIQWDEEDFCGIDSVTVPIETLWRPDITIEEMTEKDKSTQSPYLEIQNNGRVALKNDQVVVSTCRIHVYKFPFDTQSCTLSFKSVLYPETEISLSPVGDSQQNTDWSLEVMRTQYEWVLVNIKVTNKTVSPFDYPQNMVIYTINVKRRSELYIVNFILPVLFFLSLDFASFMMSDTGGEKLGFKITVLLAVTVLQLLLNEILPASSNHIPLIAVYCIGIFFLMLLSLLETILVLYLINKDSKPDQDQSDLHRCISDVISLSCCAFLCKGSRNELSSECSLDKEEKDYNSSKLTEDTQLSNKLMISLLTELLQNKKEEGRPGYWKKKTKTINKVFLICYATSAAVFLIVMVVLWTDPSTN